MIHEEICTYEACKLAKEKGYPLYTDWSKCDTWDFPTQSLLQRWLREEKSIHIEISVSVNDKHCFYWTLYNKGRDCWEEAGMCHCEYSTYELALEDALKYALEKLV